MAFLAFLLLLVLFLLGLLACKWGSETCSDAGFSWFVGGIFLMVGSFVAGLGAVVARIAFVPDNAIISQTRIAVTKLGCNASEDVMGKANDLNSNILKNRYWLHVPLIGALTPAGWDTVATIELPACATIQTEKTPK